MKLPLLSLTTRALREDSRSWGTHILRGLLVLVVLFALMSAHEMSNFYSSPGLVFFSTTLIANLLILTFVGITVFSSAITEEKESGSLGLLKLTGMNPLSILLGKSTGLLMNALLLLAVQVPFTLLAVALGGVSPIQIFAAYLLLAAYALGLCGLGLAFSVIFQRNATAARFSLALLLAFYWGPFGAGVLARWFVELGWLSPQIMYSTVEPFLRQLIGASAFTHASTILSVGFEGPIAGYTVACNAIAGLVFFILAWLLFERATRNEKAASVARPAFFRRMRRGSGRAWENAAVVWKEFRFTAGGWPILIFWFVVYGAIIFGVFWLMVRLGAPFDWNAIGYTTIVISTITTLIQAAALAGRIFSEEVKWNTLSGLALLPQTLGRIAYQKALGASIQLLPGIAWFTFGVAYCALYDPEELANIVSDIFTEPGGWYAIALGLFFLHFTAYLSLRVRRAALALAIGSIILFNMLVLQLFFFMLQSENAVLILFTAAALVASIALHPMIAARLRFHAAASG